MPIDPGGSVSPAAGFCLGKDRADDRIAQRQIAIAAGPPAHYPSAARTQHPLTQYD